MDELAVVATGVYWVRPSLRAMREALLCQGDSATVRTQLGSLVLVELEVRGAAQPLDLERVHQPDNENVPYDEVYFSLD